MQAMFLTGQHQASPALAACMLSHGFHQLCPIPAAAVLLAHIQSENHLPRSLLIMQVRLLVHPVLQIRQVSDHTVDKPDQRLAIGQKQKMGFKNTQARFQRLPCGGFSRGKTSGFQRRDCIQVLYSGCTYFHLLRLNSAAASGRGFLLVYNARFRSFCQACGCKTKDPALSGEGIRRKGRTYNIFLYHSISMASPKEKKRYFSCTATL